MTTTTSINNTEQLNSIVETQLKSLDDTDCLASAWADALDAANNNNKALSTSAVSWGGRGKGGRGLARRTFQPHSVSLEGVRLEYVSESSALPGKVLLEGAQLKLGAPRVYALVGSNGCGKSTLLRRINAGKIPGFPPHLSTLYIPQEVVPQVQKTPLEYVSSQYQEFVRQTKSANSSRMEQLEEELEQLDMTNENDAEKMEAICEEISVLEGESEDDQKMSQQKAIDALAFFGMDKSMNVPMQQLSGGDRKKVILACALVCRADILLLDEPTNYIDISGLLLLRQLISEYTNRGSTVVLVSHDVDLINDVATNVIHFSNQSLNYYPGNYRDFVGYKRQHDLHTLREPAALEKKRDSLMQTIDNLKKQPVPKRGGAKKKGRAIENAKKKLEKQGLTRDDKGHRWSAQTAGSGIRPGSINSLDAATRGKLSQSDLLKSAQLSIAPVPDKAVQFVFRNPLSTWGEPLIMAMDVGHGYAIDEAVSHETSEVKSTSTGIVRKPGFLFDCVDLCIGEGSTTCILGENGTGKSTLLRLLAKKEQPLEGKIHHASNVNVGYFDQHAVDELIENQSYSATTRTALSLLTERFPRKSEQDIRGELTAFGLSPKQALTNIKFLSGGERSRLCLATLMLGNPEVLIVDEPTSHLDVESVEALVYGLKKWNGTLIMVSHDANFIRCLDGNCFVIVKEEAKIRRIPDGIDSYLKTFRF